MISSWRDRFTAMTDQKRLAADLPDKLIEIAENQSRSLATSCQSHKRINPYEKVLIVKTIVKHLFESHRALT